MLLWNKKTDYIVGMYVSCPIRMGTAVSGMHSYSMSMYRRRISDKTTTAHSDSSKQKAMFLRYSRNEKQQ